MVYCHDRNTSKHDSRNKWKILRLYILSFIWKLSAALDNETRAKLDRRGMCLSCHKSIPNGNLAVSAMTHAADIAETKIDREMHGDIHGKLLNIGAWVQVLLALIIGGLIVWYWLRRRKK